MTLWFEPFAPWSTQLNQGSAFMPPLDVPVGEADLVLTMDLPGFTADDVEIEMLNGYLTIRGERRRPGAADGMTFAHAERPFGRFERQVRVPEGVDPDAITASMDHGVLSLIVPKPERMKPRNIAIEAGKEQRQLETTG